MTTTRRKPLRGIPAADISKSITLARTLVAYSPPLDIEITLLDYMHDLRAEIARRAARADGGRPVANFSSGDLAFSIDYATKLSALCCQPRVSIVLSDYITALSAELDKKSSGTRGRKTSPEKAKKEDAADDE
jgi:hypothetical protein